MGRSVTRDGGGRRAVRAELESRLLPVLEEARRSGPARAGTAAPPPRPRPGIRRWRLAPVRRWPLDGVGVPRPRQRRRGCPGLPLAVAWPGSRWTLVDAGVRRVEFLVEAVRALALEDRVARRRGSGRGAGPRRAVPGPVRPGRGPGFRPAGGDGRVRRRFPGRRGTGGRERAARGPARSDGRPPAWPSSDMEPAATFEAGGASYQVLRQRVAVPRSLPPPHRHPRQTAPLHAD